MKMKKRGILLGNVTNIIIAVLGLMVFGFFVVQIYKLYTNQESENAKNLLETLSAKIELLKTGESNEILIQGFNGVEKYVLAGWGENEGEAEGKPDKCFGKTCLCVCKTSKAGCQKSGICEFIDSTEIDVLTEINPPVVTYKDGKVIKTETTRDHINLEDNVLGLNVNKLEGKIYVATEIKGESVQTFSPSMK